MRTDTRAAGSTHPAAGMPTYSRSSLSLSLAVPPAALQPQKYVSWLADHFDVRLSIVFNTGVTSVISDEWALVWQVTARGPDGVWTLDAPVVPTALRFLPRPTFPRSAGSKTSRALLSYRARGFHTARGPTRVDLTGKRVAVIGSGCTGYQLVAELVRQAGHLSPFPTHAELGVM